MVTPWVEEASPEIGLVVGDLDRARAEDEPASQWSICLRLLKHYRSLMPLAQEARKPMFHLRPADGALGGHMAAVQACRRHFQDLARRVAAACGLAMA